MADVFTRTKNVITTKRIRFGKRLKPKLRMSGTVRTVALCDSFNLEAIALYFKGRDRVVVKPMTDLVWVVCTSVNMGGYSIAPGGEPVTGAFRVPRLDPDHHVNIVDPPAETNEVYHFFFFSYGVVVWWSTYPPIDDWCEGGKAFLRVLEINRNVFEVNSRMNVEPETCQWSVSKNDEGIDCDVFTLPEHDPVLMLACSHGLAQSMKLTEFETQVEGLIESTRDYPHLMDPAAHAPLPDIKTLSMKRGQLFNHRMDINLHTDILDTPKFFWTHTDTEPLYLRTRRYMEITNRVDVLNKRLEIVQELYSVLYDEIQTRTATMLELYIIWLLFLDFLVSLISFFLDLSRRHRRT